MKKLLMLSAMLGSMAFAVSSAEAKAAAPSATAEARIAGSMAQPRRWRNQPTRTVTTTRITRVGRYRYRETIRTTYFRNGTTRTRVVNRVRIVGRNW
jgi:hypothetical protein